MSESTVEPGYCRCGCGAYVGVWEITNRPRGRIKGEPKKFAPGHSCAAARSVTERFWEKVDKRGHDECWLWTAGQTGKGYGSFAAEQTGPRTHRIVGAHCFAYEDQVGPVPEGLTLDHLCRNRACVNPAHLEPVTHRENILRGEGASAKNAVKTHCIRGHEFTDENTYAVPTGGRRCRECKRERDRRYRAKCLLPGRGDAA